MKQTIRFKGLALDRDEQQAEHGELSLCGNVELHDGALRPSVLKGTVIGDDPRNFSGTLMYVHETSSYTNYITFIYNSASDYKVSRIKETGSHETILFYYPSLTGSVAFGKVHSITSVGNTLCILTDIGLFYALFKNGSYQLLGQQPPFLELQFNLKLDTYNATYNPSGNDRKNSDDHFITTDGDWYESSDDDGERKIKKDYRSTVTEQVLSKINYRLDKLAGEGYFYAPFLVRYCYRMFDGSMFMHSAPVLMASMLAHPVLTWVPAFGPNPRDTDKNKYFIYLYRCALQACCIQTSVISALQNWSDVVKSVDVFVTPQFSRIDTSGTIKSMSNTYWDDDHNWCTFDGKTIKASDLANAFSRGTVSQPWGFELPEYSEEEHFSRIKNASSFFRLCSLNITRLPGFFTADNTFKTLEYDGYILKNITTQEQMADDYKTHNQLSPMDENSGGMYVYNHRLNLYGIREKLFEGFSVKTIFPYANPSPGSPWAEIVSASSVWNVSKIEVIINTEQGTRRVSNETQGYAFGWMVSDGYIFYPDSRAVDMGFTISGGYAIVYWRSLEDSPGLNGAFSFFSKSAPVYLPSGERDPYVPLPNKLYTSRADNPFYFPNLPGESGINTIGTGEIIGLAAVTRALSPGQVGDHDLLVFATDGIWALKVSPTGSYSAMHNISREVCTNPKSICQLDQSVVFATKRSLSQIRESDSISISDVLDGPIQNLMTMFPTLYNSLAEGSDVKALFEFGTQAIEMFQKGRVLYDFSSSRLIVFDDTDSNSRISLVFSLKDAAWSTMYSDHIKAAVPGYPYPYIQQDVIVNNQVKARIMRLDVPYDHDTATARNGIVVTRTLTFSDTMDVIRGFRQYCQGTNMPSLYFFGSNNQLTWKPIGNSARSFHNYMPGHPFRFFRIAMLISSIKMSERYQALALEVINKYAKL